MNKDIFCNLHVHSDASLGDSVIRISNLIKTIEEYKQEYVALTDHGSLANWFAFRQEAKQSKVKPLFGCEFYCKETMDKPKDKNRYHLLCIAMNNNGAKNIRAMQRISVQDHHYYRPLLPYRVLFEHTDDIFISTACSLSSINQSFLQGKDEDAYSFFNSLLDAFGTSNVAIELQYHPTWNVDNSYPQNFINKKLIEMYENTDVKYIINTFDSHFCKDEDRIIRKKIQSINWKKPEKDIEDSLKSNCLGNTELCYLFGRESGIDDDIIKKCIKNTSKIAKKCYFKPKEYDRVIPDFEYHNHFEEIFCKQIY